MWWAEGLLLPRLERGCSTLGRGACDGGVLPPPRSQLSSQRWQGSRGDSGDLLCPICQRHGPRYKPTWKTGAQSRFNQRTVSGCAHTSACASRLLLPPLSYHDPFCLSDRACGCRHWTSPGRCCCLGSVCVSIGHFLDSWMCASLFRAGLWGHRPYSRCTTVAEIWQVLPAGAGDSQVTAWLGAGFGYCVIKRREMQLVRGRASPAQLSRAPPEVWEQPGSTAAIASPTQVWIIVCRYRSWLPPALADSLLSFSQETINPSVSGQDRHSSSAEV